MSFVQTVVRLTSAAALAALLVPASQVSAQAPVASPRDSVKTDISGATVSVNYGRPSKRGRDVFGGLEKWGTVWRTGANEATAFTTDKSLHFGDKMVPAGTYTLYTLLDEGGKWQLIINKQTGQWGTEYSAANDLVRIPLTVEQTPAVVEQMEITLMPVGQGGQIAILWDRTKAHASFTVMN